MNTHNPKSRRMIQIPMGILFLAILIGGWFQPLLGYFIPFCMVLGIGVGIYKGRKWCDWYCPRGSFFDGIIGPVGNGRTIPPFFRGLPLRIGFLSFLMVMMTVQIIFRWPDPYKIGGLFMILLTATTVLGITLAFVFHRRTWCGFCPIGSLAGWVGKKRYPLQLDSALCTDCKKCLKVCPVQLAPYEHKSDGVAAVIDGDCLKCNICVDKCPKKALSF
jgi:ferredoxin-type protein NapH